MARAVLLAVVCGAPGCKRTAPPDLLDARDGKFHVGESWHYRTRAGEEQSTLTVVKVESNSRLGKIVHISLNGLRLKNARVDGGISEAIGHMPFSENAVERSVTTQWKKDLRLPSYEEGYLRVQPLPDPRASRIWRRKA